MILHMDITDDLVLSQVKVHFLVFSFLFFFVFFFHFFLLTYILGFEFDFFSRMKSYI